MYIKVGNTEIRYNNPTPPFNILSEILGSKFFYEKPVLVRDPEELQIWFGEEGFSDKNYLEELLGQDLSLYLFGPFRDEFYYCRDTLRLSPGEAVKYYYPKFNDLDMFSPLEEEKVVVSLEGLDMERMINGYQTYAFKLTALEGFLEDDWFFIIPSPLNGKSGRRGRVLLYYNTIPDIPQNLYDLEIKVEGIDDILRELRESDFKVEETEEGGVYSLVSASLRIVDYFYKDSDLFKVIPDFSTSNILISEKLEQKGDIEFVSKTIGGDTPRDYLLGGGNINVKIESLGDTKYRFTISRYSYVEYFEGDISERFGEERIDNIISKNSKLVYCNIMKDKLQSIPTGEWPLLGGEITVSYKPADWMRGFREIMDNEKSILPDYHLIPDLKRYVGSLSPDLDYYSELKEIKEVLEEVGSQALIQNSPNGWTYQEVEKLPENPEEGVVYQVGGRFYVVGKNGTLEETTDREIINIYGNDFFFNYTEDLDNRLIYFYNPVKVRGMIERPGYYVYLRGFTIDSYSMSTGDINYKTPTTIVEKLKEKKSNYLVSNNLQYFYEKYQDGEGYNTTGWMRFVLGKVSREVEKKRWEIVSKKTYKEVRDIFEGIISKIKSRFSIIRVLEIEELTLNQIEGKATITLNTTISDLPKNNITIDITLNYNN